MMNTGVSFGDWLKRRRRMLDLTQKELAGQAGCSVVTIRKLEANKLRPSKQLATCLADCLDIAPEEYPSFITFARAEPYINRAAPPTAPVDPSPWDSPPGNLPPQPTPFIGRETELVEIARLIQHEPTCRLLTLVGPGGIGKTRLALQAAADAVEVFPHGVYFVSLAPVSAVGSLVPTIADALDFSFYDGADPQDQLLNYLRAKEMLLVPDNFEHLLPERGTDLLLEILTTAPQVKLLVTSRERLNLQEEWALDVQGLRFPGATDETELEALEKYSAVQLFLQRARQAQASLELSGEEGPDVVRICQLVEGMPLGLELVAAWVRMMSYQEIVQQIGRGLDFLATSLRNLPERHQSLRAVFEHSWQLLSAEERAAFAKLSVFRGGFLREAAEQVAGASLPLLAALVDKSLLRRTRAGRYEIHELLRQFAAEKLAADPGQEITVRDRHSAYYATFLQQREPDLKGAKQKAALKETEAEIENVRSGWRWAVAQGQLVEIGQSFSSLWLLYDKRGWFQEGEEAFGQVVAGLRERGAMDKPNGEKGLTLGKALSYQGWFSYRLGLPTRTRDLGQASLAVLRHLDAQGYHGARGAMATPLEFLANIARAQGEYTEAKQLLQENIAICQEIGDRWNMERAYQALHVVPRDLGDYSEAKQFLQKALAISKEVGDRWLIGYHLYDMGVVARRMGDYEEASRLHQESLGIRQGLGDRLGIGRTLYGLGTVAYHVGDYEEAKQLLQESLTIFTEIGNQSGTIDSLNTMGRIVLAQGETQAARDYFREALEMATEIQVIPKVLDALNGMALYLTKGGDKERAVELLALILHHPASWQKTIDQAAKLRAELTDKLLPAVVAAAQARGQALDLWATVNELLTELP